jgi:hypothetical protein
MATSLFEQSIARVVDEATSQVTAIMCAETLWWRCHRRLIADAAVLVYDADVWHLDHRGHLTPHRLTDGVRFEEGRLVYVHTGDGISVPAPVENKQPASGSTRSSPLVRIDGRLISSLEQ